MSTTKILKLVEKAQRAAKTQRAAKPKHAIKPARKRPAPTPRKKRRRSSGALSSATKMRILETLLITQGTQAPLQVKVKGRAKVTKQKTRRKGKLTGAALAEFKARMARGRAKAARARKGKR